MATRYEVVYEAVSANRIENNIRTKNGFLLYSSYNSPIIYNLEHRRIDTLLIGHKAETSSQNFVYDLKDEQNIDVISTSHDSSAIIWQINRENPAEYRLLHQLKVPYDCTFLTCSCYRSEDGHFYSAASTLDGNLLFWKDSNLIKTLQVGYCCFASELHHVRVEDEDLIFLYLSGSDNKVHIFQLSISRSELGEYLIDNLFDLAGYSDWVKCIDFIELTGRKNEFLVATGSQDSLVRVWHLNLICSGHNQSNSRSTLSKPLRHGASVSTRLSATLETILSGHEGFVHGLCWSKKLKDPSKLQLITCSADKTIVVWSASIAPPQSMTDEKQQRSKYEYCPASQGIWTEVQRMGETGETNLPFIGICLSETDTTILFVQSLRGAIHSWTLASSQDNLSEWIVDNSITGHFDSITDLSWDKSGSYLLSSSLDKTVRLHAIYARDKRWHELARPQVHGYEINCVCSLDFSKFASGADEKTIRTFGATRFFVKNFHELANRTSNIYEEFEKFADVEQSLPAHAQLPALGLSNRGASSPFEIGDDVVPKDDTSASALPADKDGAWNEVSDLVKQLATMDHLTRLPHEEVLLQSTLWWETNKIFGHCNELHALASDSSGKFLASASKANRKDLAQIFIWETEKFRKVATIEHHTLTVTRLKFSPNDNYLLSVSRDRTWALSERSGQMRNAYKLLFGATKTNACIHDRIIWDCCWTHDSEYFITVSRDKTASLWSVSDIRTKMQKMHDSDCQNSDTKVTFVTRSVFEHSMQAVDTLPLDWSKISDSSSVGQCPNYTFALGFENGSIALISVRRDIHRAVWEWTQLLKLEHFHQSAIRRLAFRPNGENSENSAMLASGADDCVLRITNIIFSVS